MAARCCWTRLATCRPRCRSSCCGCCRSRPFGPWAQTSPSRSTCASSRPRTAIWKPPWRRPIPRRPVLPAQRRHAAAHPGRAARRRCAAGQPLSGQAGPGYDKRLSGFCARSPQALTTAAWPGNAPALQRGRAGVRCPPRRWCRCRWCSGPAHPSAQVLSFCRSPATV